MTAIEQQATSADVGPLTYSVVAAAANLLKAANRMGDDGLQLRAFATTMCRTVAHLVEVEQTSLALADTHLSAVPEASSELLVQARAAWRRARAAHGSAALLGERVRMEFSDDAKASGAKPLFLLIGQLEQIALALTILEPPTSDHPSGAGINRLRGNDREAVDLVKVIDIREAMKAEPVTTTEKRRRAWWADADI